MPPLSSTYNLIISGNQSINTEIASLSPSSQIFFYEIDLNEIFPQLQKTILNNQFANGDQPIYNGVYRIYNDYNLYKISTSGPFEYGAIKWQDNFYYPFPITADGFDYNSVGVLPTPKFQISNLSPDHTDNSFYKYIRMQIESLDDIIG